MRLFITILFTCFNFTSFCQAGKIKIDITITDTIKPYFLDIYTHRGKTLVSKLTVATNGSYYIKELKEGNYNFEFNSPESGARRLIISNVSVVNDSTTLLKVVYPEPCKFIYPKGYKPLCPHNHSDKIIKIVYGFPLGETMKKAEKGLIRLGGCEVTGCDPKYYCTVHSIEF